MDCSPTGFSVHGISQARILQLVIISFSSYRPNPGLNLCLLHCRQVLYHWASREAPYNSYCRVNIQLPCNPVMLLKGFPQNELKCDDSDDCLGVFISVNHINNNLRQAKCLWIIYRWSFVYPSKRIYWTIKEKKILKDVTKRN